jgi:hypothetical protein
MKSFIIACVAALVIAFAAAFVLDGVQEPVSQKYQTTGVRL